MNDIEIFTETHLEKLRQQYGAIERIDPCSPRYSFLVDYVGRLDLCRRRQLAASGIKWLSYIAKQSLPKVEPSLVPACGGTEVPVTANGRRYLYCWDKNMTGTFPGDHVYVDLATDIPLSPDEHDQIFGNSR